MCFLTEIKAVGSGFAEKVLGVFFSARNRKERCSNPAPAHMNYIGLTFLLVTPLKPFHPTGSIHYPPLPGEGGMTLAAQLNL